VGLSKVALSMTKPVGISLFVFGHFIITLGTKHLPVALYKHIACFTKKQREPIRFPEGVCAHSLFFCPASGKMGHMATDEKQKDQELLEVICHEAGHAVAGAVVSMQRSCMSLPMIKIDIDSPLNPDKNVCKFGMPKNIRPDDRLLIALAGVVAQVIYRGHRRQDARLAYDVTHLTTRNDLACTSDLDGRELTRLLTRTADILEANWWAVNALVGALWVRRHLRPLEVCKMLEKWKPEQQKRKAKSYEALWNEGIDKGLYLEQ
jgi:hypothetical protein